jgi:hypothetical protein
MDGKKKGGTNIGIRFPAWQYEALEAFQKRNEMASLSEVARYLVECELNDRGYYRSDYEPSIKDGVVTAASKPERGAERVMSWC